MNQTSLLQTITLKDQNQIHKTKTSKSFHFNTPITTRLNITFTEPKIPLLHSNQSVQSLYPLHRDLMNSRIPCRALWPVSGIPVSGVTFGRHWSRTVKRVIWGSKRAHFIGCDCLGLDWFVINVWWVILEGKASLQSHGWPILPRDVSKEGDFPGEVINCALYY